MSSPSQKNKKQKDSNINKKPNWDYSLSKDQQRRISRKLSITIYPDNEDFIRKVLLPNNPVFDNSFSRAVNQCVEIVRISHGYK